MPVTDNDICCALAQSARSPDTYRQAVLELLYGIGTGGGGGGGTVTFSGGTSSAGLNSLVFSNAHGVSFGLSGSTLTGSVGAGVGAGSISAGSTNVALGQAIFSNSNNVSFGLAGSTLTASASFAQSQQSQNIIRDVNIVGNTSGVTADITSGTLLLAGGNNVTLSQAGNAITISAASQSVQPQTSLNYSNSNNVSFGIAGSTLTASASFAQSSQPQSSLSFSNVNGVTFGTAGSTLTASVAAQSVQTQGLFDAQIGGNTSGVTALVSSGTLTLAGGNNVTLSQAGNAITISAAAQSVQPQTSLNYSNSNNVSFGIAGSTLTASASFAQSSQPQSSLSFSNINGVTFGTAGSTLTASVASQSVQTQNLHVDIIGGNTSGTTASISSGTMTLAGGNNITLSQAGNAITISAAAQSIQTQSALDVNIAGNTSGATADISSGTLVLAGGNNITLSQVGNAVTISGAAAAGGGATLSQVWLHLDGASTAAILNSISNSMYLQWNSVNAPVSASIARLLFKGTIATSTSPTSTLSGATTISLGIYTLNGLSLSLASSGSRQMSWSDVSGGNMSIFGGPNNGYQFIDIPITCLLPSDRHFWLGWLHSVAGSTMTRVDFAKEIVNSSFPALWGSSISVSGPGVFPFHGLMSASSNALPASVGLSAFSSLGAFRPSMALAPQFLNYS